MPPTLRRRARPPARRARRSRPQRGGASWCSRSRGGLAQRRHVAGGERGHEQRGPADVEDRVVDRDVGARAWCAIRRWTWRTTAPTSPSPDRRRAARAPRARRRWPRRRRTARRRRCRRGPPAAVSASTARVRGRSIVGRSRGAARARPPAPPTRTAPLKPMPRPIGIGDRTHSSPSPPWRRNAIVAGWCSSARCAPSGTPSSPTADLGVERRAPCRARRNRGPGSPTTPAPEDGHQAQTPRRPCSATTSTPCGQRAAAASAAAAAPLSIEAPPARGPPPTTSATPATTSPAAALSTTMLRCGAVLAGHHAADAPRR